MGKKPKRPWSVRNRTLPPDLASRQEMFLRAHRELIGVAQHYKTNQHDSRAKHTLQGLHTQRSIAWMGMYQLSPQHALALAAELNLRFSGEISEVI